MSPIYIQNILSSRYVGRCDVLVAWGGTSSILLTGSNILRMGRSCEWAVHKHTRSCIFSSFEQYLTKVCESRSHRCEIVVS